jgi:transcriptional regulator with XRE-family HTH domain
MEVTPEEAELRRQSDAIRHALEAKTLPRASEEARRRAIEAARRKKHARKIAALWGVNLGQVRKAFGITQEQVAEDLGTKRPAVSRIESGEYGGLTLERFFLYAASISERAGIDPAALFPRREPEHHGSAQLKLYLPGVRELQTPPKEVA